MAKDPSFTPSKLSLPVPSGEKENSIDRVVRLGGSRLVEYLHEWFAGVSADRDVLKEKFEEIVWMNTLVYVVGGWAGRKEGGDEAKEFNGDFF